MLLEYAVCVGLVFVVGTLLFGTCAAFVTVEEGVRLLRDFVRTFVSSRGPAMRATTQLTLEGR
jgi:hypothetical protein